MSGDRLGGQVARRPLRFIWLLDVSGSMAADGKIQSLNAAIEETIPLLREDARANPEAEVTVQVMSFATAPAWLFDVPVPVEEFHWNPISAVPQGLTELGRALQALVPVMRDLRTGGRGFAPAIVLVSDGRPTHVHGPSLDEALAGLLAEPWGRASVRAAVGIGRDADMKALHHFMGDGDLTPVRADNPEELVATLQWVSRMATNMASSPAGERPAPPPPVESPSGLGQRVWDVTT